MTPGSASRRRGGLSCLSWLLCGLSVLASAVSVGFPVFAVNLRDASAAGAGVPDGISALAFPLALLIFLILEIPVLAAGLGLWRAFLSVRRHAHGG